MNARLRTRTFLRRLVASLKELHNEGFVHNSLSPLSIFVDKPARTVKLGDFSAVLPGTGLCFENSLSKTPEKLLAPESSGHINACVDFLTDYYVLGGILRMVWNAASKDDRREDIETAMERLLKKSPEERYQSLDSLLYDLGLVSAAPDYWWRACW